MFIQQMIVKQLQYSRDHPSSRSDGQCILRAVVEMDTKIETNKMISVSIGADVENKQVKEIE